MARAKAKTKAQARTTRRGCVAFKASGEFKTWLEAFARSERDTPSRTIEIALVALARARDFDEAPAR